VVALSASHTSPRNESVGASVSVPAWRVCTASPRGAASQSPLTSSPSCSTLLPRVDQTHGNSVVVAAATSPHLASRTLSRAQSYVCIEPEVRGAHGNDAPANVEAIGASLTVAAAEAPRIRLTNNSLAGAYGTATPARTDSKATPQTSPRRFLAAPVGSDPRHSTVQRDHGELGVGGGMGFDLGSLAAAGDMLCVRGNGRLERIGASGGFLGHVLLVLGPPQRIARHSELGTWLSGVWPSGSPTEVWQVPTLESTSQEAGLHQASMLLRVDEDTSQILLFGELPATDANEVFAIDEQVVEVWQCPSELRALLTRDIVEKVLADMKACEASWSLKTAARAVLLSASHFHSAGKAAVLKEVRACWSAEPICTSVIITFWQRCLCQLAWAAESGGACSALRSPKGFSHPTDLILRWMPLKADRGLPGELMQAMRSCGWKAVTKAPRRRRSGGFCFSRSPRA